MPPNLAKYLQRLPGRHHNALQFTVEFRDGEKGLEDLVDLAVHGKPGEYVLGKTNASSPLGEITVAMHVVDGVYHLIAYLEKAKNLKVDFKYIERADFGVIGERKESLVWLTNRGLPNNSHLEFSLIPLKAAELRYRLDVNELTVEEAARPISVFRTALEATINSIYKAHGVRLEQPKTLELSVGEEVKRIRIEGNTHFTNYTRERAGSKPPMAAPHELGEPVTLEDIGGLSKKTKGIIQLLILACTNPELLESYGAQPLRGALFYGPSGTGKTSIGRAIANTAGINFHYLNLAEITSKWYGEAERNMVGFLEGIKKQGRGILYIDEIESLAQQREGAHEATARLVNVLNQYMGGLQNMKGIVVIGATNMRERIDKATLSRFNYELEVPLPDVQGREEIFRIHMKKAAGRADRPLYGDLDVPAIAKATGNYSGRDISTLIDRVGLARLAAERLSGDTIRLITTQDFLNEKAAYDREKRGGASKGAIGFKK